MQPLPEIVSKGRILPSRESWSFLLFFPSSLLLPTLLPSFWIIELPLCNPSETAGCNEKNRNTAQGIVETLKTIKIKTKQYPSEDICVQCRLIFLPHRLRIALFPLTQLSIINLTLRLFFEGIENVAEWENFPHVWLLRCSVFLQIGKRYCRPH